jgi:hypothetical protein
MWDLWWTKWQWGSFFSKLFNFLCQYHSTVTLHTHISGGWTKGPLVAAVQRHSLTPSRHGATCWKIMLSVVCFVGHFQVMYHVNYLLGHFTYHVPIKLKAVCTSETSVFFNETKGQHYPRWLSSSRMETMIYICTLYAHFKVSLWEKTSFGNCIQSVGYTW